MKNFSDALMPDRRNVVGIPWIRVIVAGFVAEVLTILTILATIFVYGHLMNRDLSKMEYDAFSAKAGFYIGPLGGPAMVFVMAIWAVRKNISAFVMSGVLVGIVSL